MILNTFYKMIMDNSRNYLLNLFLLIVRLHEIPYMSVSRQSSKDPKTKSVSLLKQLSFRLLSRTMIPKRTGVSVVPSSWGRSLVHTWKCVFLEMHRIVMKPMLTISHAWTSKLWRNWTKTKNLWRNCVSTYD
jgi:hypothetical protein